MGFYSKEWAAAVVDKWQKSNPRVELMCERMAHWASVLGVKNPREFVDGRLIFWLQRAKTRNVWSLIKLFAEKEIQWKYLFCEYIATKDVGLEGGDSFQYLLPQDETEISTIGLLADRRESYPQVE